MSTAALSAVLALSEAMLRSAEAGEWLELAEKERQRRILFNDPLPPPADDAAREAMAQSLRRILELDRQTAALAQTGRDTAAAELRALQAGRTAATAYRHTVAVNDER